MLLKFFSLKNIFLTKKKKKRKKKKKKAGHQWFTLVILATQESEIRRIAVQSQPNSRELTWKKIHHNKGLVEWLKVKVLSSNPSIAKKKKERKKKEKNMAHI
jgi:hypothetical protein